MNESIHRGLELHRTKSIKMNNPSGTAFQQNVVSSYSIDPEEKPQEVEKRQEAKNIGLRSWLKLPYGTLLFRKIANKNERRKIIAFAVVSVFLLVTFWNSLEQDQLKEDLEKSIPEETLLSGKISENSVGDANFRNAVVIYAEIDAHGKPVIPVRTPAEVVKQLQRLQFDPPRRNGLPVRVKIPISLSIE